jgi:N-acetylglutamate synthase-like GNAT family acetyltransferase
MIRVRAATADDQPAIVKVVREARINPMDLRWPHFVVAVDEASGAVVGTGQIKLHGDGSREVASIATIPAYQRRGIAHQVIERLLMDQTGELYLTCLESMGPFYELFGFRTVADRDLTPYFRRLKKIAGALHFLGPRGERLLVMRRPAPKSAADGQGDAGH